MEILTFYHTWLPFIYLYGVGGIAFLIGMFLIIRNRALILEKIHHKKKLLAALSSMKSSKHLAGKLDITEVSRYFIIFPPSIKNKSLPNY